MDQPLQKMDVDGVAEVFPLPRPVPPVLAVGGFLKNTVCLAEGGEARLSRDNGNLETAEAILAFEAAAERLAADGLITGVGTINGRKVFFSAYEGHDVAEGIERSNAGVSRSRECLHRGHLHRFQTESILQRTQCRDESDRGAVRIRDDKAVAAPVLPLHERRVIGIDLRDQQRDVLLHTVVSRIRDYRIAGLREGTFDLSGYARIEPGKHEIAVEPGCRLTDDQIGE